jgi:endonuclease YncB( thermonuclease family)
MITKGSYAFILLAGLALLAGVLPLIQPLASPIEPAVVEILDGDTIKIGGKTIRLVGFNTPETGSRAKCESERTLGAAASRRLRELVAGGGLDLEQVPCACRPGTEGTPACNRGRSCGVLKVRGQEVGAILISEGLARPFVCGAQSCPARQGWCEGAAAVPTPLSYRLSGNGWLQDCRSQDYQAHAHCQGFTAGFAHGLSYVDTLVCFPDGITTGQLIEVGKRYLARSPQACTCTSACCSLARFARRGRAATVNGNDETDYRNRNHPGAVGKCRYRPGLGIRYQISLPMCLHAHGCRCLEGHLHLRSYRAQSICWRVF